MRRRISGTPAESYVAQMHGFAEVIRGEATPVGSGENGARTSTASGAIMPAAPSGGPVRIDDMLKRR